MTTENYSVTNAMVDIIAAPGKAMEEVKKHPRWFWTPLAIIILLPIACFLFYFNWVDFEWLIDDTIRVATQDAPDADTAAAMGDAIRGFMSPVKSSLFGAIAVVVFTFLIFAIQSGYLNLVNKVAGDPSIGYGQWFSFSTWTAFVGIFASIGMVIVILMADSNQLAQDQLNALSFQNLFIHAETGSAWFNWGNALSLTNIWMLVLMTIGFNRWTGSSMVKSAVIVSAPWVLVFGIWALMIS